MTRKRSLIPRSSLKKVRRPLIDAKSSCGCCINFHAFNQDDLTDWFIECKQSKQCAPAKHHFEECVERVQQQEGEGDGEAKEDCVEECKHRIP